MVGLHADFSVSSDVIDIDSFISACLLGTYDVLGAVLGTGLQQQAKQTKNPALTVLSS